jgi:peroxiredoxin Q/BCP
MSQSLVAGEAAPAFSLLDQSSATVSLADFLGRDVLVYFYPKADTPGCTTQACGLRDALGQLGGAAVVGISPDDPAALARFDAKYGLGFPLLSDPDHSVADSYGVWGEKSMYGKKYLGIVRSAFLVGADGTLAEVWYKISPKDTPKKLLAALAARR